MQLLAKSLCLWLALLTASTASASGRFLSADPMGHDASMSLYDYCNGDPVNGLDPDGRMGVGANVESDGLDGEMSSFAASASTPLVNESDYEQRVDDIMAAGGVTTAQAEQEIAAQDWFNNSPEAQSAVLNLIPGVNLAEAFTGTDIVTDKPIDDEQRFLDANFGLMQVAGGVSGAAEGFASDEAVDMSLGTALDQNVQLTQYGLDEAGAAETAPTQLEFDFVNSLPEKPPINWPPNRGFAGDPVPTTLSPGTMVDRYGYNGGTFVSPQGVPYIQRSLAPGTQYKPYNLFQVMKPIDVNGGPAAPAFGMPGNGMQYELPSSVQSLIDSGHLQPVTGG